MRFAKALVIGSILVSSLVLSGCSGLSFGAAETPTPTPTATCAPGANGLSAYELWVVEGNKGTVSDFLKSLVGAKGKDGYVGFSGASGTDGTAGVAGVAGPSAYQIWLDAGNVGTPEEFLTSLRGVAGAAGLNGLSAYDLWLSLGNTGTATEFLDSLKGVDGVNGTNGTDGTNGVDGTNGTNGADGICTVGQTGEPGPQGPQGPQGLPGVDGVNGTNGADGARGPAGPTLTPSAVSYVMAGGTIGGTQPTFNGNPMFYGSYVAMGDLVFFNVKVVMTNITSFGTGQYYVSLPFNSANPISTSSGRITDFSSARNYTLNGSAQGGSDQLLLTYSSGSQQLAFDHNSPVNLTTSDTFFISGTYIKQ